jgi:hypothetical protein
VLDAAIAYQANGQTDKRTNMVTAFRGPGGPLEELAGNLHDTGLDFSRILDPAQPWIDAALSEP